MRENTVGEQDMEKRGEIPMELTELKEAVALLTSSIEKLIKVIDPVLSPERPTPVGEDRPVKNSVLGEQLFNVREDLHGLRQLVTDTISRVEL